MKRKNTPNDNCRQNEKGVSNSSWEEQPRKKRNNVVVKRDWFEMTMESLTDATKALDNAAKMLEVGAKSIADKSNALKQLIGMFDFFDEVEEEDA